MHKHFSRLWYSTHKKKKTSDGIHFQKLDFFCFIHFYLHPFRLIPTYHRQIIIPYSGSSRFFSLRLYPQSFFESVFHFLHNVQEYALPGLPYLNR